MFEVVADQQINWIGIELDERRAVAVFNYIDRSYPIRHVISINNVNTNTTNYYLKSYELINCESKTSYVYRNDIVFTDQTVVRVEPVDKQKNISDDKFYEFVCADSNPVWMLTYADGLRLVSEFLEKNVKNR